MICEYQIHQVFKSRGRMYANKKHSGCAVGLAGSFRLLGAINNNTFAKSLPGEVTAATPNFDNMSALMKAAAANTAAAYAAVPGISAEVIAATQMAVKQAYVQAYRTTYLSALGFGAAAIAAALLTKSTALLWRKLRNELETACGGKWAGV
jgi:hypothetical protein